MSLSGMTEPKDIQYPKYHHCGGQYEDHVWMDLDEKHGLCPIEANHERIKAYAAWVRRENPDADLPEVLWDIEEAEQWGDQ